MARRKKKTSLVARLLKKVNWRVLLWLVVLGTLVASLSVGARAGWEALRHRPEFVFSSTRLCFTRPPLCVEMESGEPADDESAPRAATVSLGCCPPWVKPRPMLDEFRRELAGVLSGGSASRQALEVPLGPVSIFKNDLCSQVQHELRASPWLADVTEVKRLFPRGLRAEVVFLRPKGIAELRGERLMVDRDGHILPGRLFREPPSWNDRQIPVIRHGNPSRHVWPGGYGADPALAVGARLSEFLLAQNLPDPLKIATIEVTRVGRGDIEPDVVLVTRDGIEIRWGCTDAYEEIRSLNRPPSEYPDRDKVQMLKQVLEQYPDLQGVQHINVRYRDISVRPAGTQTPP